MLTIGNPAPVFGCDAVVNHDVVPLDWGQLHSRRTLVLQFGSGDWQTDYLVDLCNASRELDRVRAKVAVVCRDPLFECLKLAEQIAEKGRREGPSFPIIIDSCNEIAATYDMLAVDGRTLWGHAIIDASGDLRQIAISSFHLPVKVRELLRCITAIDKDD